MKPFTPACLRSDMRSYKGTPNNNKNNKQQRKRGPRGSNGPQSKSIVLASAVVSRASMSLNILPRKLIRTLRFSSTQALTTAATTGFCAAPSVFRLTSIWDPYAGVGGSSAYGTSQLATWYSFYQVLGCKVTIIGSTIGGTAEVAVVYKVDTPDGYLALTGQSFDRCSMAPMCGVFLVGPSGNDRTNRADFNVLPWAALGISKQQWIDESLSNGATMTANPASTTVPTLQISACSPSATAGETVTVQVILDFLTELSQPIQLAAST